MFPNSRLTPSVDGGARLREKRKVLLESVVTRRRLTRSIKLTLAFLFNIVEIISLAERDARMTLPARGSAHVKPITGRVLSRM